MKCVSIILAVLALTAGVTAAGFWYKSTRVPGPTYGFEPVELEGKIHDQAGITAQMNIGANRIAFLNRIASILTTVAAILAALSSIAGNLT